MCRQLQRNVCIKLWRQLQGKLWIQLQRQLCRKLQKHFAHIHGGPCSAQKLYAKFRNPRTTFENLTLCPAKYSIVRGEWGSPKDFCGDNLNMNIRHIHLSTTWYNKQMAGLTNTGFLRPIQFQYNNQYL